MNDIVERLRQGWIKPLHTPTEFAEAADEIESLRQQLADKHQLFMCASSNYDRLAEHLVFANDQITELQRKRDELVAALIREKGVWAYDKEYKVSNYSRIHVDQRIEAIDAALAKVGADKTGEKTPQVDAHWPSIRMDISEGVCGTCKLGAENCDVDLDGHCGGLK